MPAQRPAFFEVCERRLADHAFFFSRATSVRSACANRRLNVGNTFYYSSVADGNIVGSPGANTAYLAPPRTYLASIKMDF